jgi:hypothetical protein
MYAVRLPTCRGAFVALAAALILLALPGRGEAGPPTGAGTYDQFVALVQEFVTWRDPAPGADGLVDYSAAAVAGRAEQLRKLQARLQDMNVAAWNRSQQAEWLAIRAQMDQHDFVVNVARPWARDPGYYVDQMLQVTFTELPVPKDRLADVRARLKRVPALAAAARQNLDASIVPADFAKLALFNLTNSDGVGHGHPYRETPPAGVIGWYDDFLARAKKQQPALVKDIERARAAAVDLHGWLGEQAPKMTQPAGFGEKLFDWYLLNVKYMPYTSREIQVMAQRELERVWAFYALERHRNRALPELTLPKSREEYEARIASVADDARKFIIDEQFMTIPEYIPTDFRKMGFNVPWIVRPRGPNYWEQVQYRDPSPDYWHAVMPGHRFDALMLNRITHPVRKHIRDGGRSEGWALYLEEAPLQLGFYDEKRQRTRELIYDFAIFRAVRTIGDVHMQHNEMSTKEVAEYWKKWTPYLDDDVARVDAEIYLRRPPGYGLGYTVGSFQVYKLLGERRHQLGDKFVLKDFHDQFMAAGGLPVALIRYEMTGYDDEVRRFWDRPALADVLKKN